MAKTAMEDESFSAWQWESVCEDKHYRNAKGLEIFKSNNKSYICGILAAIGKVLPVGIDIGNKETTPRLAAINCLTQLNTIFQHFRLKTLLHDQFPGQAQESRAKIRHGHADCRRTQ